MKFIHTSDWHLGRTLHNRRRYEEMSAFLEWLIKIIQEREAEALLLAGDVFDNTTPSPLAQKMYYDFLHQAQSVGCQIVVIGGNHDSAALLDAPSDLCKLLGIHVVGRIDVNKNPAREVIVLKNSSDNQHGLIVCAVPFLRSSDVRIDAGETESSERQEAMQRGIQEHYLNVISRAREIQSNIHAQENIKVPIVVMGHLFVQGGKVTDGDGVRDLYVGNLGQCSVDLFPSDVCYIALGHVHGAQLIRGAGPDGLGTMCYSGSPIPMGFNEAGSQKSVCFVDTDKPSNPEIIPVPVFQRLEQVKGDLDIIESRLNELKLNASGETIWLDVTYTGLDCSLDIAEFVKNNIEGTKLELVTAKSQARTREIEVRLRSIGGAGLDSIGPEEVFERCLDENKVEESKRENLIATFREALDAVEVN